MIKVGDLSQMPLLIFGPVKAFSYRLIMIFNVVLRGSSGFLSGSGSQREYSFRKNKVGDLS